MVESDINFQLLPTKAIVKTFGQMRQRNISIQPNFLFCMDYILPPGVHIDAMVLFQSLCYLPKMVCL